MRTMFTPLKIAGMEVKNRTFMAPMSLGYESQDGTVNEKMEAYWLRRAQGGVGCIIVDATSVDPNVPYLGNTLCFRDEESIKKYKSFTDKVHSYGCKIIPQITHQCIFRSSASSQQFISELYGADDKRAGKRRTSGYCRSLCQSV